jgi:tetratricopeptide (TPR) repeat protein
MKILNDYPESHLLEQAKIWMGVISENLEAAKKIDKIKETNKEKEDRKETVEKKETVREVVKTKQPEIKIEESKEGREHLLRGQKFLGQGNYEGAMGENQKVLTLSDPKSQRDEALFNLGLIYAHFGNPQRDPEKSLESFKNLIKHYPKSPFVDQAKIWVSILEENVLLNQLIQKLKQVDIEIEEMRRKRTQ